MTLIESSVNALENHNLVVNSTLEDIIGHNRHVGFTAFGRGSCHIQPAHILKFPDIKPSFGLTSISNFTRSGEFTCERSDIYLISVTVMACADGDAIYDIYKNKISLMQYYVTQSSCNSGSGTLLKVNDMVYVETHSRMKYVYYK
ncbi:Hypothetical predicted protein [Mytilus galloprovincialis]|uniref:C1q domain-containing protein n=1 Tax=Mytilus galloprovincialis TaxID=29158 RepID=A0A8B6DPV9_MYTGA|nr:Hypothetical predicted protein [Mytilus galloprovincialis]